MCIFWCDASSAVKSVPHVHRHISLFTCVNISCLLLHAVPIQRFLSRKSRMDREQRGACMSNCLHVMNRSQTEFKYKVHFKNTSKNEKGKMVWLFDSQRLGKFLFFLNRFEAPLKQIQKKIKKISKGFLKILFYIWNYTYGTHLYISHEQYLLNYIGKYTLTDFF